MIGKGAAGARFGAAVCTAALIMTACSGGDDNEGSNAPDDGDGGESQQADTSPRAEENTLTLISRQDPGDWDITTNSNTFLWLWIPGNVLETLWVLDDDGEPQPNLADEWEISEDQTEYTFHLRDGVTFHNGDPLTADDVAFSLQTYKDSPNAVRSTPLDEVETIEAVDETTVRVTLNEPSRSFFEAMGGISGAIFAESAYDDIASNPVGTGPYVFSEYQQDDHMTLEINPDYWGEPATLEEVTVRFVPDATAALNSVQAGEVDGYSQIGQEFWERLDTEGYRDSHNVQVREYGGAILFIAFNSLAEPYDDIEVRQALAHAIERQPYADVFGGSDALVPTCTFATADQPWFEREAEDDCMFPYDPEQAAQLLADAGHADTEFELTSITDIGNLAPPADILRAQLEAAGVNVDDNALEFARYNEQVFAGDPPEFGITPMFTPRGMEQFNCPDPDNAGWNSFCNQEVTDLLQQADSAESAEEQTRLMNEAMAILQEQAVIIPILASQSVGLYHPDLQIGAGSEVFLEVNLAELSWQ